MNKRTACALPGSDSMLQTDQQFPSVSSQKNISRNAGGCYDIYFDPTAPAGRESN